MVDRVAALRAAEELVDALMPQHHEGGVPRPTPPGIPPGDGPLRGPPPGRDALLAQYELAVAWLLHEDARRWTIVGFAAATQAALAAGVAALVDETDAWILEAMLALAGVMTSLIAIFFLKRTRDYMRDREEIIRLLQARLAVPNALRFYPERGGEGEARRTQMLLDSRGSVTCTAYVVLWVVAAVWAGALAWDVVCGAWRC